VISFCHDWAKNDTKRPPGWQLIVSASAGFSGGFCRANRTLNQQSWAATKSAIPVASFNVGRRIDLLPAMRHFGIMKTLGFTYWQDGKDWIGYLDEFPDYLTQGASLEDLQEHLQDLYRDLSSGAIPNVRRHAQLELA
jgi:hypothetical protein